MKPCWVCVAVVIVMAPTIFAADRKDNEQIERVLDAIHAKENTTAQELITAHPELLQAAKLTTGKPGRIDGYQPIHVAVEAGNLTMARWLVEHGTDVNAPATTKTFHGESTGCRKTPLDVAIDSDSLEMVKFLIESNATVSKHSLHTALIDERVEIVQYLLEHGCTADIFSAAAMGNLEQLNGFLKDHPNLEATTQYEYKALHFAAGYGRLDAVKLLLKAGANINAETRPLLTTNGRTPLCEALNGKHSDVALFLIDSAADVNANPEYPALHLAVIGNDPAVVKALLAHKCRIESRDVMGRTALHEAVYKSLLPMVLLLLENGADPNALEEDNHYPSSSGEPPDFTSLDIAVEKQAKQLCEALIQHGGKLNKVPREKLKDVLNKKD